MNGGLYPSVYGLLRALRDGASGRRAQHAYRLASEEQWLTASELERRQLVRLNAVLRHAAARSSYYRRRFAGIFDPERGLSKLADLARLPLLERADLQDHAGEMLCPVDDSVYRDSSGGSTGHPVNFYHDAGYREFATGLQRLFLSWISIAPGDRTAIFWGADRDFRAESRRRRLRARWERRIALNSFSVEPADLDRFLAQVARFRPAYVFGYASSLALAAQRIIESGRFTIRPRAVRSSAERLLPETRATIARAFDCPIFDFYGSREINTIAAECPAQAGLHVFASGRIVEVIDDDGRPLPAGRVGRLVVTDLSNRSFPFIRYVIGDLGSLATNICPCGRGYPLLASLAGRISDVLRLGGKYIHGEFFTHLFYGKPGVRQFQVIQQAEDQVAIRIVGEANAIDRAALVRHVQEHAQTNVAVDVQFVDRIETGPAGKHRFTINRMLERV